MKKPLLILMSILFGIVLIFTNFQNVSAQSRSATIISTHKLAKEPYRAVSGYLYSSAHLSHKRHNADNYPLTTFYATRSAAVKKSNGNRAVYYYVKNGNGHVSGWIWRGYLVRLINVSKQRQNINQLISEIDSLSTSTQQKMIKLLKGVQKNDLLGHLLTEVNQLSKMVSQNQDAQKLKKIYQILESDGQTLAAIFQNGLNRLASGVVACHQFNNKVFALANGLLARLPS